VAWHAKLALQYRVENGRCVARFEHDGPLRILQALYPEGDGVCHTVLVHPPGGLVGGDTLEIAIHAAPGAHGLVTTPGASRFYRSEDGPAVQRTRIRLDEGARLEWLPLEAICYSGCIAENRLSMHLAPGSELMGWDITALGLPASAQPFDSGTLLQHLELEGAWLERGRIDAGDARLMEGPLGLAGHRCVATLFLAAGDDLPKPRRELALELARAALAGHPLAVTAGATAPGGRVVAVRVLAPLVEPAMDLLKAIRDAWRPALWGLPANRPRGWAI
jgi:urease accessory protein